jgi:hypothetical protein
VDGNNKEVRPLLPPTPARPQGLTTLFTYPTDEVAKPRGPSHTYIHTYIHTYTPWQVRAKPPSEKWRTTRMVEDLVNMVGEIMYPKVRVCVCVCVCLCVCVCACVCVRVSIGPGVRVGVVLDAVVRRPVCAYMIRGTKHDTSLTLTPLMPLSLHRLRWASTGMTSPRWARLIIKGPQK